MKSTHRIFVCFGKITVDGDTCKFGEKPEHLKLVTDMIDAKLYGLFPIE